MARRAEDDVRFRKLQPIYNAIDARNFKSAIKLCSKKELERWDIVKALKAYALDKTGKTEEALELCREVKARNPTDETVLSTLLLTYKATGMEREATECYENAHKAHPDNHDLSRELFFCYCRERGFAKAQQLATKLYKQFNRKEYIFWAAVMMQLQVQNGGVVTLRTLAERMVAKALDQSPTDVAPSFDELELYLSFLRETGKMEDALVALRAYGDRPSPASKIVDETTVADRNIVPMSTRERREAEALLLTTLNRPEEAHSVYHAILHHHPDQWSCWQGLLSSSLPSPPQPLTSSSCPLLVKTKSLIRDLHAQHPLERGPALASLELLRHIIERGDITTIPDFLADGGAVSPLEKLRSEVVDYVTHYGTKLCCFDDLVPYLSLLVREGGKEREALTAFVIKENPLQDVSEEELKSLPKAEVTRRLRMFTLAQQILRYLGAQEDNHQVLPSLVGVYFRTLFVNEDCEGGQREVQLGDDLILLAAHVLRDGVRKAEDKGETEVALKKRIELVCLIEQTNKFSPYNYHFKILLNQLYHELGAFEPAIGLHNALEIKQIQLETLSWLLFPGCMDTGLFHEAHSRAADVVRFHRGGQRDASEFFVKSLGMGTYTKALEIDTFQRNKMDRSLQLALAKTEYSLLELLLHFPTLDGAVNYLRTLAMGMAFESLMDLSQKDIEALSDNMDYAVVRSWDYQPKGQKEEAAKIRKDRHVKRIKLRITSFRLLLAVLEGDLTTLTDRLKEYQARLSDIGYWSPAPGKNKACEDLIHRQCERRLDAHIRRRCLSIPSQQDGDGLEDTATRLASLNLNGSPSANSHWDLNLLTYHTALLALQCLHPPEGGDASPPPIDRARASLSSLTQSINHWSTILSSPNEAPGHLNLLSATWLKTVCKFLSLTASPLSLILQKLSSSLPQGGKKKGKKTAKGGAGAGGEELGQDLREAVAALISLLTQLEDKLKEFRSAKPEPSPEAAATLWADTYVAGEDFQEMRKSVLSKVRESNVLSCQRIADLVKDRVAVLRALQ